MRWAQFKMASWLSQLQAKTETFLEQVDAVAADQLKVITPARGSRADGTPHAEGEEDEPPVARKPSQHDILSLLNGDEAKEPARPQAATPVKRSLSSTTASRGLDKMEVKPPAAAPAAVATTGASPDPALAQLQLENKMLKSEITALEDEVASFASRMRASQDTLAETKESLVSARQQLADVTSARNKLNTEAAKLRESLAGKDKEFARLQAQISAQQEQLRIAQQQREAMLADHLSAGDVQSRNIESLRSEIEMLKANTHNGDAALASSRADFEARLRTAEGSLAERSKQVAELEAALQQSKATLSEQATSASTLRQELDKLSREYSDYKVRATRILQSKDKAIEDLRGGTGGGEPGTMDAETLRRQHDALATELEEARTQVAELTTKLQDLQQQQQADTEWTEARIAELEQQYREEKEHRVAAEAARDSKDRDVQALTDELARTQHNLQAAAAARQAEMESLQAQLARRPALSVAQAEAEQRYHTMTASLLQKQQQLEAAVAEKSALALQLETERRRHREEQRSSVTRPEVHAVPMGTAWEEGSLPIRAAFVSGSADTPMIRRVKQAANVVDSFSIRLGVFLRRFPAARIFVLIYMALMHMWVMIVLLTYTPEMHSEHGGQPGMPGMPVQPVHL
eukprot:m.242406 g.242406  ORF g.242406 m.242406 type:complete len:636 (-) comp14032_c0_seq1:258-2165(-)